MNGEISPNGVWSLEDGIWVNSISESSGIIIKDSVVTGDVIQNITINDQDYVSNAVKDALNNLGFIEGKHPSKISDLDRIQLTHTISLADAISERNITLDAWLEISLGYACELENNILAARTHFEKALEVGVAHADQRLILHSKLGIATLDMKIGKLNLAEKSVKKIRTSFKKINDEIGLSNAEEILGLIAYSRGNYDLSKSRHEKSLGIRKSIGYEDGISTSTINLGNVAMSQGKVNTAGNLLSKVDAAEQSERDEAQLLCSKGVNEMQKRNLSKALNLLEKSLAIRKKINDKTGQTECYNYMGTANMMKGDFHKGRSICRKALKLADEINDIPAKAHALYHIGQASISLGDLNSGIYEIKEARTLFSSSEDREGVSNCNIMLRKLGVFDLEMMLQPKVLLGLGTVFLLIVFILWN